VADVAEVATFRFALPNQRRVESIRGIHAVSAGNIWQRQPEWPEFGALGRRPEGDTMFRKLFGFLRDPEPAATSRPRRSPTLNVEWLDERLVPTVVSVSGQSNIYAAGLPAAFLPPSPAGGGVRPREVSLAALGYPAKLTFPAVTGAVSGWAAAGGYNGPDGGKSWGGKTAVPALGGISGIRNDNATMFLVGVFLGPTGQPAKAPPSLDATRANTAATSSPALGQQFFLGDGKTKAGVLQTVTVPAGATTLYLGFAEGWGFGLGRQPGFYADNGGALKVDVRAAPTSLDPQGLLHERWLAARSILIGFYQDNKSNPNVAPFAQQMLNLANLSDPAKNAWAGGVVLASLEFAAKDFVARRDYWSHPERWTGADALFIIGANTAFTVVGNRHVSEQLSPAFHSYIHSQFDAVLASHPSNLGDALLTAGRRIVGDHELFLSNAADPSVSQLGGVNLATRVAARVSIPRIAKYTRQRAFDDVISGLRQRGALTATEACLLSTTLDSNHI